MERPYYTLILSRDLHGAIVPQVTSVTYVLVSRWLPTAAAGAHVRAVCGVYGGQSGTGAGFLRILLFPLPIIIPPIFPYSQSPEAGTICLLVAAVPSGPNWTPPSTIPI
jgi:hypothetical protein